MQDGCNVGAALTRRRSGTDAGNAGPGAALALALALASCVRARAGVEVERAERRRALGGHERCCRHGEPENDEGVGTGAPLQLRRGDRRR